MMIVENKMKVVVVKDRASGSSGDGGIGADGIHFHCNCGGESEDGYTGRRDVDGRGEEVCDVIGEDLRVRRWFVWCRWLFRAISSHSNPLDIKNGVRQGDTLACLLFNVTLEKVVRDANLLSRGTIFYRSVQILAYADDIDIVARSRRAMEDTFWNIEKAGRNMGLTINQSKTKYMACGKANLKNMPSSITIGRYDFERVDEFKYLGPTVTHSNDTSYEIKQSETVNKGQKIRIEMNCLECAALPPTVRQGMFMDDVTLCHNLGGICNRCAFHSGQHSWLDGCQAGILHRTSRRQTYGPVVQCGPTMPQTSKLSRSRRRIEHFSPTTVLLLLCTVEEYSSVLTTVEKAA
ncbi:hypothetical protein ANN_02513 [Periplaneta americana]|uniref:Reverse transcriptase domain-containing protein n=1 Tax=Periplaneta americana TaxID=6978 RepID=A0ABQ8TWK2_PERAM|nr:hypothetical protein ANN_02513 [Periplaneta americana]